MKAAKRLPRLVANGSMAGAALFPLGRAAAQAQVQLDAELDEPKGA
jgi:hypothetical protein